MLVIVLGTVSRSVFSNRFEFRPARLQPTPYGQLKSSRAVACQQWRRRARRQRRRPNQRSLLVGWLFRAGKYLEWREHGRRDGRKDLHLLIEQTGDMRRRTAAVGGTDITGNIPYRARRMAARIVRCLNADIMAPRADLRISVACSACI